ncbi:MAG: helix-turn-helix transcriptional regulator [Actinomycetia bacterium]|nr:helix-turn-helix transcriptional regulator [Actinomycetes bacterium]MCP4961472.1 helix-turn-helix transcriptional regulator [Actinomycetes bacterium]
MAGLDSEQHRLLDVLGHRWALRVVFELGGGALGFNELRRRCDSMSPSVLSKRLNEMRGVSLVDHDDFDSWELSEKGYAVACALNTLVRVEKASPTESPGRAG